jgi:hypothetical protein
MSDTNPETTPITTQEPQALVQPVVPTNPNSLFADQLAGIKADDGRQKYADVTTALASLPHAQTHITEQAARIAELEAKVNKQEGMESILEQLKSQQPAAAIPAATGIDETSLATLLDAKLAERDATQTANTNQAAVLNNLATKYGDKAEELFNSKAATLGVSVGFLSDLARKAPDAVLAYFNEAPTVPTNPTQGTINTTMQQAPSQDMSHLNVFKSGVSDSLSKWREVSKQN